VKYVDEIESSILFDVYKRKQKRKNFWRKTKKRRGAGLLEIGFDMGN
tara:strand:+ start:102 stop:242 length:141 start_codon:yes stop_codon:yes gene_type:complete